MKSFLYAGAALMIGASVYGFVDYKNNQSDQEFTGMYKEPVVESKVPSVKEEKNIPVPISKTLPAAKTKKVSGKTEVLSKKERKLQPIADEARIETKRMVGLETVAVEAPDGAERSTLVKKSKKNRKISTKLFSRAPLREDRTDEKIMPVKTAKRNE